MSFIDFDDFYRICSDRNNECKHEEVIIIRLKNQPSLDQPSEEKSLQLGPFGTQAKTDGFTEDKHRFLI